MPNLSRMGDQQGAKTGTSIDVFLGFFARLARTRSLLLIIEEVDALLHATNAASFRYVVAKLEALATTGACASSTLRNWVPRSKGEERTLWRRPFPP
jgi:hypothetical protein